MCMCVLVLTNMCEGLVEDGGQRGVQLLLDVLQQHRGSRLDRALQNPQEVRHLEVYHLQTLHTHIHRTHTHQQTHT